LWQQLDVNDEIHRANQATVPRTESLFCLE
jgi:hypothetical protein